MLDKKYLPSASATFLIITIICSLFFLKWVFGPLSFEIALQSEQKGHSLFAQKKYIDAYGFFLDAAENENDSVAAGKRYRYAAVSLMASGNKEKAKEYFELALKYNKNDEVSKEQLKYLAKKNE